MYGARPLKRAIQQQLENPLAQRILAGEFGPGDTIKVDVEGRRAGYAKIAGEGSPMPFYEYQCAACGHHHEELQKVADRPLRKCPACGRATLQRLVSAPVFRLKGGGWYETDFKSDKESQRNIAGEKEPAADEARRTRSRPKRTSKADAKPADAKADAKPAEKTAEPRQEAAGGRASRSRRGASAARRRPARR